MNDQITEQQTRIAAQAAHIAVLHTALRGFGEACQQVIDSSVEYYKNVPDEATRNHEMVTAIEPMRGALASITAALEVSEGDALQLLIVARQCAQQCESAIGDILDELLDRMGAPQ